LKLKKPASSRNLDNRVFFPEEIKRSGTKKQEVYDREKVETCIKGILEEYLISGDSKEACLCATELVEKLPKDNSDINIYLFVLQTLNLGTEKKDKDRELLNNLLLEMYEAKILSKDDFEAGFKDVLDIAEDLVFDFPKFFDVVAVILAKLIIIGALKLSYLSTDATKPLQAANKEKLVILVLKAINGQAPEKLVSLYNESGLKLSSLITSSSLKSVLKDQGLNTLSGIVS